MDGWMDGWMIHLWAPSSGWWTQEFIRPHPHIALRVLIAVECTSVVHSLLQCIIG